MARRPPWSVDHPDKKLGQDCYIVRGRADRHALVYVYFRGRAGPAGRAHLLTRDQARRMAANFAKLPEIPTKPATLKETILEIGRC